MPSPQKYIDAFAYKRVQNTTTETTIKSSAGILRRLLVSDGGAGTGGTVTIRDGSGIIFVAEIADGGLVDLPFDIAFDQLSIQNSAATLDVLAVYS